MNMLGRVLTAHDRLHAAGDWRQRRPSMHPWVSRETLQGRRGCKQLEGSHRLFSSVVRRMSTVASYGIPALGYNDVNKWCTLCGLNQGTSQKAGTFKLSARLKSRWLPTFFKRKERVINPSENRYESYHHSPWCAVVAKFILRGLLAEARFPGDLHARTIAGGISVHGNRKEKDKDVYTRRT